ncbi:MAG: hypothetical protein WD688_00580 [Candidatus Binatia bacterium]
MAEDKFKLPRSSYEEICKIVKAYGRLFEPASLDEVAHLCAMNPTAISANNAFLSNIAVIEGGQKKSATVKGKDLAKALEHEIPNVIQESWERIVRENEFLMKMAAAVKIRGKMDSSTLESHIAYSAGEAKSKPVMTGARAVVDILRASGVVRENEGQLVSTETSPQPIEATLNVALEPIGIAPTGHAAGRSIARAIGDTGVTLHIELRIDAKPSELDGLGEKIKKLLRDLKKTEEDDGGNDS